MAQEHPDALFVFGDNMSHSGLGGQAKELRGEPNAVGIVTKWFPDMKETSFFTDEDKESVDFFIVRSFQRLEEALVSGKFVYWPKDGIGTGLAQLATRAPEIQYLIDMGLYRLKMLASFIVEPLDKVT
jgi:hypothetical protein